MGTIDMVKIIKMAQPKDIIMIKIGKFIYTYGKDAYIMSYVFQYKLRQVENNIYTCGFPRNKLNNIEATLENRKINYKVLDKKNSYRLDEENDNKNLNQYDNYLEKAKIYVKRKNKIDYIYGNLMKNIEKEEVDDVLSSIKRVIDERRKI